METITQETVKDWATAIVAEIEPDDIFVVEDGFKATPEDWHRADAQDEGRFVDGVEVSTFAAMVVPFLLGFFGDVAKDVVKDVAKKAVGALLDRFLKREATSDETARLQGEIDVAIAKSRFTAEQKRTLRDGFEALFAKLGSDSTPAAAP
ncbi:MAG TPA: hypothetical protein VGU24_07185 [Microvirga sp.]|jgi:hypothetical protein|nr:hypothetical protein [Microvirga sp.]